MKVQFRLSTLLLAMTFICISLGGWTASYAMGVKKYHEVPSDRVFLFIFFGTLGIPGAFAMTAIQAKRLTVRSILAFALTQAIGLGILSWISGRP